MPGAFHELSSHEARSIPVRPRRKRSFLYREDLWQQGSCDLFRPLLRKKHKRHRIKTGQSQSHRWEELEAAHRASDKIFPNAFAKTSQAESQNLPQGLLQTKLANARTSYQSKRKQVLTPQVNDESAVTSSVDSNVSNSVIEAAAISIIEDETKLRRSLLELNWHDVLIPMILSRLSVTDLFHLRAASRDCHQLVEEYFTVTRKLDLSSVKSTISREAVQMLSTHCCHLRVLNLSGCKTIVTDELLRPIITHNHLLHTINLSGCHQLTAACLHAVTVNCKQLKRLILSDCHWVTRSSMEYLAHHQSRLVSINLTGCWELVDTTIYNLLSKFTSLQSVSLANIYPLTDKTMRALANFTPRLRVLDVRGCWRITDAGMAIVSKYCRNLETIYVSDCRDITEKSLSVLRQHDVKIDRLANPYSLNTETSFEHTIPNIF